MTPDYHTHTTFSDGISSHTSYLNQANYASIDQLGFSDHFSILDSHWSVANKDIQSMKEQVQSILMAENLPVQIKFGAEIDYIPGKERQIKELIQSMPFDYVIGSVHFIGNWNFDTDPQSFRGKDIDELYDQYYHLVRQSIHSGLYDIIGHIDLIKKFGHFPDSDPTRWHKKIIRSLKKMGPVVEVNTNGMNKPCGEFYPDKTFLQMCFHNNIPVTLGSDAHEANQIGQYFGKAKELLKNIGYRKIAFFDKRKRSMENF
jgi:histidinol-phosphatase (PHP family)